MTVDYRVISIGTLAKNRLWNEGAPVRTSHATTTLVVEEGRTILVDPSLPARALAAVFHERTGKRLEDVTDVFCTTLRPVHRRSISALPDAAWWVHADELEWYRTRLEEAGDVADRLGGDEAGDLEAERRLLNAFRAAPEQFGSQTTVYPLAGASPGSAGLLLTPPTMSIVVAGDAAVTADHVREGQIWEGCADVDAARRTMADFLELADVIVPGHDNVLFAPGRYM